MLWHDIMLLRSYSMTFMAILAIYSMLLVSYHHVQQKQRWEVIIDRAETNTPFTRIFARLHKYSNINNMISL